MALVLATASPAMVRAQGPTQTPLRAPRSLDYLFAADVQDARSLWVNPAGLGAFLQASVMGEVVVDRLAVPGGDLSLAQYSIAFNSRGFALGYEHDQFAGVDAPNSTFRIGLARGFSNVSFGASLGFYRADVTQRGLDLGLRYRVAAPVALAMVLRDIGNPALRGVVIHKRGIAGVTLTLLQGQMTLSGEAQAAERPVLQTGYDVTYRAGAELQSGGRLPLSGLVALDLGNNGKIDRWSVGLAIGGTDRVVSAATFVPSTGSTEFNRFSVSGVATRRPPH
jgi:hypothetical protein